MMSKGNYSLSKNQRRGNIVSYAVLIIGALLVILPILWMFITALKDDLEIYQMNGRILPEAITATSFIRIWKDYDFVLYFRNSLRCYSCCSIDFAGSVHTDRIWCNKI